ncbi:hypothetical protein GIB67_005747 [Kingdonia uniflora]|uniref:Glycosyl transferase family 1 domain-containing protein n=1 Tax=Kingdonia uniflora TaxID=39325 RepID=A0A7J7KVG5_9MAGN|nr:hypothetical protein GIB67_005747 [Kingdonia uniflora]
MGRNSTSPEITSPVDDNGDLGFKPIRDRFPLKRNPNSHSHAHHESHKDHDEKLDRHWRGRLHHNRPNRKGFSFKGTYLFYGAVVFAVLVFVVASVLLQSTMTSVFRQGRESGKALREGLKMGGSLRFVPVGLLRRFGNESGVGRLRLENRVGIRAPRLAIILGNMRKDPLSLMVFTVLKSLRELGYVLKIYAVEKGKAHSLWEQIGGQVSTISLNSTGRVDWSNYEGIIVDSLEAKEVISSLMQEPFCSIPLIWIVQEDLLAKRLPLYVEMGWENLVVEWRSSFSRADIVVYPDFSLPMLYSVLDTGNFFVIPGSPVNVWGAESYIKTHSKDQLRKDNGVHMDDLVVLVVGSSIFYDELSLDYAVAMHAIGPLLRKFSRKDADGSFKFVFLCGNSTDGYNDALEGVASHLGLPRGSLTHYGLDGDVNSVLLRADIILHGSFQDEQGFPPLLVRAMTFGIPVIAPDLPIITKYVIDGVHGLIFKKHKPDTLMRAFSLLVSKRELSKFAHVIASSGKLLAKNMLASDCVSGYAKLLENVLHFPSYASLPIPVSHLQKHTWEWNLFGKEIEIPNQSSGTRKSSVVYVLEEEFALLGSNMSTSQNETEILSLENPTELDWTVLREIENSEELERREKDELEGRTERGLGSWDEIYRNARRSEKLKFEPNERDEGELERIGQSLCIYEIYTGAGASPFLHHGSLYRGLSLIVKFVIFELVRWISDHPTFLLSQSPKARRSRSDDVDAVNRLPLLNDTFYKDLLCEFGGMFSISNRVDNIHKVPWIGFQSWHATGRKIAPSSPTAPQSVEKRGGASRDNEKAVSLSIKAEKVLEETIQAETEGDVVYYWSKVDLDNGVAGGNDILTFWSLCDILNGGRCRTVFGDSFRQMYGLPPDIEALPPMPEDGGKWSALHSWVMPTPSFLEFMMFSRIFVDSLDSLHNDTSNTKCLLGSSELEKKHCYCRMLELLVNVWAYHSARRMVYIDPISGSLEEQHLIEERKGFMWVKYFNITLLKSMDEDLAEAADDNEYPREEWLWPLTGEVHWQGIYEREREERYRQKMDKKRKTKEKLLERQKYGYRQKTLGRRT